MTITIELARTTPRGMPAVGVPVYLEGAVPRSLGLSRASLNALGFEGKVGQALAVPGGEGSVAIAVGMGALGQVTTATLRSAAAALARAAERQVAVATSIADVPGVDARAAGQAVAEGFVLASYRNGGLKRDRRLPALDRVVLVAEPGRHRGLATGTARGLTIGAATNYARELANTPPSRLNAADFADQAAQVGRAQSLAVDVWDEERLIEERCNGLLNVNRGSAEPPRLVTMTYTPRNPVATVALVGKGITFDSGGLSIKTNEGMKDMKMDMAGAAAVLATMRALPELKPRVKVIGYLCCTDNLPSGTALKVSDVITYRDGTTVEVLNTDAEGRLVLADALILATEQKVDAIVDIATLTGSCMAALGLEYAGLMANHDALATQVLAAAGRADERLWRLPLPGEYERQLDSEVADMKNVGTVYGGALVAGLFLQRFVGATPWAHLDIAGPMRTDADSGWQAKGATGYGVRTLVDFVESFAPLG